MISLKKPSENLGGILKIWAVPPTDVLIQYHEANIVSTDRIIELYCTPGTMSFSEKETTQKPGKLFETELKGFIPYSNTEYSPILDELSRKKWVLVFMDENQLFRICGTPEIPLRASLNLDTGSAMSDSNGILISFFGTQTQKAIFISNPFFS